MKLKPNSHCYKHYKRYKCYKHYKRYKCNKHYKRCITDSTQAQIAPTFVKIGISKSGPMQGSVPWDAIPTKIA
jgi:hypothetical protein